MTTCTATEIRSRRSLRSAVVNSRAVSTMAQMFASVLEKSVTNIEALHILNAMLSFSALLLFGGISVVVAALMLCWFAISVYQCSRD